jgi:N-acetylneuraminate synthase
MYIIAELSANHGQRFERAAELIREAAACGADAVKLQTFTPASMTVDADRPELRAGGDTLWAGRRLYDLYEEAMTPWEWHADLKRVAEEAGLDLFSTPFDGAAVEFLVDLGVPALKVASFELVDLQLVGMAASTRLPLLLSTGMATVDEIDDAVRVAREHGAGDIVLLRCNSAYPASPAEMDLRTIPDMVDRWNVPVGLSDHTLGPLAAVTARALGACVLEKHFTLDRSEPGPDAAFSMEPDDLRTLVDSIREAEASMGAVRYGPSPSERASLAFRRSLYVVRDVPAGTALTRDDVRTLRPATGLPPKKLADVLGRRASRDLHAGEPLTEDALSS